MTESSFMLEALELAKKGQYTSRPGASVGCIISKDNKIIGEGFYEYFGAKHAEIVAIESVKEKYQNFEEVLSGSVITVTLEPCSTFGKTPPCIDEVLKYNFKKIVIGNLDPSQSSLDRLKKSGMEVVIEQLPNGLNKGFFKTLEKHKPYVRAKIAMSEDKKIAFINDDNQWITSPESRLDSHKYRALSDLVITGSGTIKRDNPALTVRDDEIIKLNNFIQPARAIVSANSSLDKNLKIFKTAGRKLIFCTEKKVFNDVEGIENLNLYEIKESDNQIDLSDLMKKITELGMHDILLESGPKLISSFIEANLIDEFIIYIAPKILSNTALSFFNGDDSKSPFYSDEFELIEESVIKKDKKLIYRRKNGTE
ncbi:MAG: riboflavin biosynthesis protein RibD [Flavobacteriaceae bacterium]|jgi:diaminohydroxyphosphoribosylaminopyrimidine deaminase/5-amino-6-(5-phosphoribosylamino)uracil reductase|nr:riboflavin biosynthesis protein RibD [Flavobacteriaceae bacterium]|tara:strand:- start:4805 stop:5908 length:1104 start_codon:yes stop_codon:yes gene_type:complete